jgi:hypothetical protein
MEFPDPKEPPTISALMNTIKTRNLAFTRPVDLLHPGLRTSPAPRGYGYFLHRNHAPVLTLVLTFMALSFLVDMSPAVGAHRSVARCCPDGPHQEALPLNLWRVLPHPNRGRGVGTLPKRMLLRAGGLKKTRNAQRAAPGGSSYLLGAS